MVFNKNYFTFSNFRKTMIIILLIFFLSYQTVSFEENNTSDSTKLNEKVTNILESYNSRKTSEFKDLVYFNYYKNESYGLFKPENKEISGFNSNYMFLLDINSTNPKQDYIVLNYTKLKYRIVNNKYTYNIPIQEEYHQVIMKNQLFAPMLYYDTNLSKLIFSQIVTNPFETNKELDFELKCDGIERLNDEDFQYRITQTIYPEELRIYHKEFDILYPNEFSCKLHTTYRESNISKTYNFTKFPDNIEELEININSLNYGFFIQTINRENISSIIQVKLNFSNNVEVYPNLEEIAISENENKETRIYVLPKENDLIEEKIEVKIFYNDKIIKNETIIVNFGKTIKEGEFSTFLILIFFSIILFIIAILINLPEKINK